MYLTMVYTTAVIMLLGTAYYAVSIVRGKFAPPLGAFLILSVSFGLSWLVYTKIPDWSWTSNIGLASAVVSAWSLTATLLFFTLKKSRLSVSFNKTQKRTIIGAGCIILFWLVTDDPFWAYVLLQVLALVGYWPLVKSLYNEEHNDSLVLWGAIWLSVLVSIYPAWQRANIEAYIYIVRAMVGATAVVALLVRTRLRARRIPVVSI